MEVVKGRIVGTGEKTEIITEEPKKEVELLTAPVPVRRYRLSFGAILTVQLITAVIFGALLFFSERTEELGTLSDILRHIVCG